MTCASSPNSSTRPNSWSGTSNWIVTTENHSEGLLAYLHKQLRGQKSKKEIKRELERKCCLVNGQLESFGSRRLTAGDVVTWHSAKVSGLKLTHVLPQLLYEDEAILVLNKPAGLVSENSIVCDYLGRQGELFLAHRLDKETTGTLLIAKSKAVCELLEEQFRKRTVQKHYLAITATTPKERAGVIRLPLMRQIIDGRPHFRAAAKGEKGSLSAETAWQVVGNHPLGVLLACQPKTGRTHQIRIHLASIGCSIAGDSLYGGGALHRCLLHASAIAFHHPCAYQGMKVTAPDPEDFLL